MSTTQFVFIRHGETEWNHAQKLQGWRDSRLTVRGKRQLSKTNYARLHNEKQMQCNALYCSDLGRAMASARLVANQIGALIIPDAKLRERELGELTTKFAVDLPKRYHQRFNQPIGAQYQVESDSAFEKRVSSWIKAMAARHPNQTVWVVSHGEWLRTARNLIEGQQGWQWGAGIPANGQPLLITLQSAQ